MTIRVIETDEATGLKREYVRSTKFVEHVHCSRCGKRCSGVDPELGLVVRAYVECPECIETTERRGAVAPDLRALLVQGVCPHTNRAGGNDYMLCNGCGLFWDWRKQQPHDAWRELVDKALAAVLRSEPAE